MANTKYLDCATIWAVVNHEVPAVKAPHVFTKLGTWPTYVFKFGDQLHPVIELLNDSICCRCIILGDVSPDVSQVTLRCERQLQAF